MNRLNKIRWIIENFNRYFEEIPPLITSLRHCKSPLSMGNQLYWDKIIIILQEMHYVNLLFLIAGHKNYMDLPQGNSLMWTSHRKIFWEIFLETFSWAKILSTCASLLRLQVFEWSLLPHYVLIPTK